MKKARKRRNTIAQDLRTAKYRPRVVKSKKVYSRKKNKKVEPNPPGGFGVLADFYEKGS